MSGLMHRLKKLFDASHCCCCCGCCCCANGCCEAK